jgi:DNA-binding HxlR family transcriptional regulator
MRPLTGQQLVALKAMRSNHGTCTDFMISLEGIYSSSVTMNALVRRGLVKRGDWINENEGYEYELTPSGWLAA